MSGILKRLIAIPVIIIMLCLLMTMIFPLLYWIITGKDFMSKVDDIIIDLILK